VTAHAGDPYVGMIGYYDIAFCRVGPSNRDRIYNLVAHAKGVSIDEVQLKMKDFHAAVCPFSKKISSANIVSYAYHLKHGCKATKIKPIRIYAELADAIIFDDGLIFNVG